MTRQVIKGMKNRPHAQATRPMNIHYSSALKLAASVVKVKVGMNAEVRSRGVEKEVIVQS